MDIYEELALFSLANRPKKLLKNPCHCPLQMYDAKEIDAYFGGLIKMLQRYRKIAYTTWKRSSSQHHCIRDSAEGQYNVLGQILGTACSESSESGRK